VRGFSGAAGIVALLLAKLIHATFAVRTRWATVALAVCAACASLAKADETCSSPYLARIEGQEEFL
jgi:hypothetical protein